MLDMWVMIFHSLAGPVEGQKIWGGLVLIITRLSDETIFITNSIKNQGGKGKCPLAPWPLSFRRPYWWLHKKQKLSILTYHPTTLCSNSPLAPGAYCYIERLMSNEQCSLALFSRKCKRLRDCKNKTFHFNAKSLSIGISQSHWDVGRDWEH